jgi:hypothetical protein
MRVSRVSGFSMLAWQLADGFQSLSQLATTKTRGTPELLSFAIFSGASVRRVLCRLKVHHLRTRFVAVDPHLTSGRTPGSSIATLSTPAFVPYPDSNLQPRLRDRTTVCCRVAYNKPLLADGLSDTLKSFVSPLPTASALGPRHCTSCRYFNQRYVSRLYTSTTTNNGIRPASSME